MDNLINTKKLIEISKDLEEHANSMENATGYRKNKFNYAYYALIRQNAKKEMEDLENERSTKSSR